MKDKIHFIVNSRLVKAKTILERELKNNSYWEKNYQVFVWESLYKGHALELTQKAIRDDSKTVVACGGDGTINEIGRYLIETDIPLGIVPLGSGNGFARHFKIPLNIRAALQVIQAKTRVSIDAGLINQHFFLSNVGVGFEAHFINSYQKKSTRGFISYCKALVVALRAFIVNKHRIYYAGKTREITPFSLMVSNTNQFGYNFSLTPESSISDGKLELIIFKSKSVLALFKLFFASRFGVKLSQDLLEIIPVSKVRIALESSEFLFQFDGEINQCSSKEIVVQLHPRKLKVWVPS
jgi:YegS/Rv2252/BmrU family lipid kinase